MKKNRISLGEVIQEELKDPEFRELFEKEQIINAISREIYELRVEQNLTQKELAEKMGTKQPVIARLESGCDSRVPSLALLIKFAHACGGELKINFGIRSNILKF